MTDEELFQIRPRIWILYEKVPLDSGGMGWTDKAIYQFREHVPMDTVERHRDTLKLVCYTAE
jgi:hypothetical protein